MYRQFKHVPLVSISDAQRAPLADIGVTWAGTVHHGLAPDRFAFSPEPGGYLAFLGRLSPEKQPDVAIEVARRSGLPLRIAAKIDAADREYVARVIAPLLEDPLIEFIGEIGDADKSAFLGGARAAFPIDWPEPFGLVMLEAMACGTRYRPACGSVPEVVSGRQRLHRQLGTGAGGCREAHRHHRPRAMPPRFRAALQRGADGRRLRGPLPARRRASARRMSDERPRDDLIIGEHYYILASSVAADLPKLVLKHDTAFLVADRRGDFPEHSREFALRRRHALS